MEPEPTDGDDYLMKFETIRNIINETQAAVDMVNEQPHDQARIECMQACMLKQQELNETLYELLVEMNNYFAPG